MKTIHERAIFSLFPLDANFNRDFSASMHRHTDFGSAYRHLESVICPDLQNWVILNEKTSEQKNYQWRQIGEDYVIIDLDTNSYFRTREITGGHTKIVGGKVDQSVILESDWADAIERMVFAKAGDDLSFFLIFSDWIEENFADQNLAKLYRDMVTQSHPNCAFHLRNNPDRYWLLWSLQDVLKEKSIIVQCYEYTAIMFQNVHLNLTFEITKME